MYITSKCNGDVLTLAMEGRVDSSSAPNVEGEINSAVSATPHSSVVIDAEKLEYISSAGLRVILKLLKEQKKLEIINASSEVYDIFDMTGFSEMIPISKAYRRVSVENCEVIGKGANGEVYRLDPETIIKVYLHPDSLDDIKRERELARRAFVLGIPTAISYDVVRVGESYGSVFELLNAKSLAKLVSEEPENFDKYVGIFVDLLKKIHSTQLKPHELPDIKDVVGQWTGRITGHLPEDKYNKILELVAKTEDRCTMIHGDYHTKNVMIQNGEALLIDMDTLAEGHPVFELGSVFNAFCGFSEVDHNTVERFLGMKYEKAREFWEKTLRLYLDTDDEEYIKTVENKAKLVGYIRLFQRNIRTENYKTELGKAEYDAYKQRILELLDLVDSLEF